MKYLDGYNFEIFFCRLYCPCHKTVDLIYISQINFPNNQLIIVSFMSPIKNPTKILHIYTILDENGAKMPKKPIFVTK